MMIYKFKISVLIILALFTTSSLYSQIIVNQSEVDFSLKIEQDSIYRILTFWKDKDSSIYTSVKYSVSDFNHNSAKKNLTDEISTINQLWDIANDSITFKLQSFNIDYPLLYADILKNHIQAFLDSDEWQNHVKQNGKKLDYEIIKRVMLEANIYVSLDDFLKSKGFSIYGFETEKHGYVTKENLQKAGYSGDEIIPMPFIVWIILTKIY